MSQHYEPHDLPADFPMERYPKGGNFIDPIGERLLIEGAVELCSLAWQGQTHSKRNRLDLIFMRGGPLVLVPEDLRLPPMNVRPARDFLRGLGWRVLDWNSWEYSSSYARWTDRLSVLRSWDAHVKRCRDPKLNELRPWPISARDADRALVAMDNALRLAGWGEVLEEGIAARILAAPFQYPPGAPLLLPRKGKAGFYPLGTLARPGATACLDSTHRDIETQVLLEHGLYRLGRAMDMRTVSMERHIPTADARLSRDETRDFTPDERAFLLDYLVGQGVAPSREGLEWDIELGIRL